MSDSQYTSSSSKWQFAWIRQKTVIPVAMVAIAITSLIVRPWNLQPQLGWWQAMDPILSMTTLAVALLVWWGEVTESWEQSLPRMLRVEFVYKGQAILVCENAPLLSEADSRALAQQIGMQMNEGKPLALLPFVEQLFSKIECTSNGSVQRYEIRMTLKELPEAMRVRHEKQPNDCKVWRVVKGIPQESFESTVRSAK